jgi:phosphoribosyl 1,2-cyclic phosphodiesterase
MSESEQRLFDLACAVAQNRKCISDSVPIETMADNTSSLVMESTIVGCEDANVCMLASGSKGNAAFIQCGSKRILIDAGISYRRICRGLHDVGCDVSDLDAVFITHEHSDHVSGLPVLLKHSAMPVYTTRETWQAIGEAIEPYDRRFVRLTRKVCLGAMDVVPFATSHDAAYPVGYTVYSSGCKITLATDLGYVSPDVEAAAAGSDILILESNHDEELLRHGPYPRSVQSRILSRLGHLSNRTAADFLTRIPRRRLMKVLLAHRSEKNNTPSIAWQTMHTVLDQAGINIGQDILLRLACQTGRVSFNTKE